MEGKLFYVLERKEDQKVYGSPFSSKKSLDESIEILKKFNPNFSEEYRIIVYQIEYKGFEEV